MSPISPFERTRRFLQDNVYPRPQILRQFLASLLSLALLVPAFAETLPAFQDSTTGAQQDQSNAAPARAPQTPDQLQQLVAPIALYPDSLVAQVLAASTYPEQVVEADRWVQANPNLKGDDLAKAVDQQNWDPSVKALCAFPSVLANMDKNLSWTSSLGDAYYNQAQDVMDAIQVMRQKAEDAGNLKSTPQQSVTTEGSSVEIAPVDPTYVYVPEYNPWLIYGYPITPWPYWYPVPGIWFGGPSLYFGVGFGIGWFGGYGWGWPYWGFDWGRRVVVYNHNTYYSRSTTFYNRNSYYRGGGGPGRGPGPAYNRPGTPNRPFGGDTRAARGYAPESTPGRPGEFNRPGNAPREPAYNPPREPSYNGPRGGSESGGRSSAFSGYNGGGQARSEYSRGSASFGGGGHGGGGGRHR
jgi:uncharacterized membrane protein YgcG